MDGVLVDDGPGDREAPTAKGGFRTQREARSHLNAILEKVEQGAWRPDAKLTVRQLLEDHWLPAKKAEGLRPATASLYRGAINKWIAPHVGALDARQLTPAVVATMVETLRTKGGRNAAPLSPRSVQIAVGTLKSATAWSARTGLLGRDPLASYRRPKVQTPVMKAWTADEAKGFLAVTAGDRLAAGWALLLTRGLRRGELCGLKWEDVDLDGGVLRIVRTRVIVDNKPVESLPKTAAGRRGIPLDPMLVALLRRHKVAQATERLRGGEAYEDGGWLLADEMGRPYYPDSISGMFERKVRDAKMRRIRLHDLRHTAATLMLADGVPVKTVADRLGHDPRITLATYAHAVPGLGEAAGAALSARLLG